MHGVRTEVDGLVAGVHFLFVESSGNIRFSATAQTALIENRTRTDITNPGNVSFAHVVIKKGGMLDLVRVRDTLVSVTSALFEIHYQGKVTVNHGIFYSTFAEVETQGTVILDGAGYPTGSGPGSGSTSPNGRGSGGGYGGQGGTSYLSHPGGNAYGSVFSPLSRGSGGGSGQAAGGAGENQQNRISDYFRKVLMGEFFISLQIIHYMCNSIILNYISFLELALWNNLRG